MNDRSENDTNVKILKLIGRIAALAIEASEHLVAADSIATAAFLGRSVTSQNGSPLEPLPRQCPGVQHRALQATLNTAWDGLAIANFNWLCYTLWRSLELNAILPLREAMRPPVLDLGCGDGQFSRMIFSEVNVGIDMDAAALAHARRSLLYHHLCQADVSRSLPFASESFATVFSNCVMEHIADLRQSVGEAVRVLRGGGLLILTVPTPHFLAYISESYGSRDADLFNRQQGHLHLLSVNEWVEILAGAGLSNIQHRQYCSAAAARWFRLFSARPFRGIEAVFRRPIHSLMLAFVINLIRKSVDLREGAGMIVWGVKQ